MAMVLELSGLLKRTLLRYFNPIHSSCVYWWLRQFGSTEMTMSERHAVVFAPHQDDETFGCGGMIAMKRCNRLEVTVVFMTDGSGSRGRNGVKASAELVGIRRREAMKAAKILGVCSENVFFLNLPDTKLNNLGEEQRESAVRKIQEILEQSPAAEIFVPHRRDIHPDHESTFEIVMEAIQSERGSRVVFEYSIWMTWLAKLGRSLRITEFHGARRLAIASVLALKKDAMNAYESQHRALPAHFTDRFALPFEIFFARSCDEPAC